jgi:hypothetical protein
MKTRLNLFLYVLFIISAGAISIIIMFYNINIGHKPRPDILEPAPRQEALMTGFQFTEYNGKDKAFVINAEKFYLRNKKVRYFGFRVALGKSAELEGVEAEFYEGDKLVSRLHSNAAAMDIKDKNIVFEGAPVLITEDKKMLSAKRIAWDNSQRRLSAEGRCVLAAAGKRHRARRVNADAGLTDFTITGEEG